MSCSRDPLTRSANRRARRQRKAGADNATSGSDHRCGALRTEELLRKGKRRRKASLSRSANRRAGAKIEARENKGASRSADKRARPQENVPRRTISRAAPRREMRENKELAGSADRRAGQKPKSTGKTKSFSGRSSFEDPGNSAAAWRFGFLSSSAKRRAAKALRGGENPLSSGKSPCGPRRLFAEPQNEKVRESMEKSGHGPRERRRSAARLARREASASSSGAYRARSRDRARPGRLLSGGCLGSDASAAQRRRVWPLTTVPSFRT
jgi:hypothetical protein